MQLSKTGTLLCMLAILALAAVLRLTNLETNPGWYTDEGTHIEIANNLLEGKTQYLAITDSHLLFSRLPLFGRLLAFVGQGNGVDMLILRQLTASLGTLSVGLTMLVSWSIFEDHWISLAAGLSLAIYPDAVLYSRFGFSYNLLAPLLLLALWCVSQSSKEKASETFGGWRPSWHLYLAALSIGLGAISDLAMISLIPWLLWFSCQRSWQDGVISSVIVGAPLSLFVLSNLVWGWDAFWFDLNFVRSRLGGRSFFDQLWLVAQNFTLLLNQSSWFALGFVGLWFVPARNQRNILLLALAFPILVLGRTTPLVELSFYYISWVLPILAIGLGALIHAGFSFISDQWGQRFTGRMIAGFIIAVPLVVSAVLTLERAETSFGTNIDRFLLDPEDAQAAIEFINQSTGLEDLVIASPGLAWELDVQRADFQMALAAEGITTPHLPENLPEERFAFDSSFANADYVVEDNLWRNWAYFHMPELQEKRATFSGWPIVFSSGEVVIYQNPQKN